MRFWFISPRFTADASYAYLAEKENLKLVTADTDLLKKCKAAITINEMK